MDRDRPVIISALLKGKEIALQSRKYATANPFVTGHAAIDQSIDITRPSQLDGMPAESEHQTLSLGLGVYNELYPSMQVPQALFKYTTASTTRIVLSSGRIRWSSPERFNDPAEFQRLPVFSPSLKESMNIALRLIIDAAAGDAEIDVTRLCPPTRQLYDVAHFGISRGLKKKDFLECTTQENRPLDTAYHEQLRSFFGENFTKQARVLCLTANPLNPAMWANYANNHDGCLLEFEHLPAFDTPLQEARPVVYTENPPCIGSGVDMILYNPPELRGKTIDAICFTKRKEWEYEQEWRVVTWRSNEGNDMHGDYPFLPEELASVTFGLRATQQTIEDITALIKAGYPNASLFKIVNVYGDLSMAEV